MRGMKHPFTRALYEADDEGRVTVTHGTKSGLFHANGQWIHGDIFEADPHLCAWIGGPKMAHHRI